MALAAEGTFVLADIGGYTKFLTGVGIEHAKETTEHLLNRLIKTTDRKWKVANVMGDCVFFYSETPESPAETYRLLRGLHEEFQEAQLDIASGSTCRCGACDRTEDLSLKFVVHAGEFGVQNIGGRKELIGQDIIVATRLLKNSVPAREYVISTPAAAGLAEAAGEPAHPGRDELESIGPMEYTYIDLGPVRDAYQKSRAFYVSPEEADMTVVGLIDAPASVVWSAMTTLEKRKLWQVTISKMEHIQGELDKVGEVHSCVHGAKKIVHSTLAVDEETMQRTERTWISPPVMKDIYFTLQAIPLSENKTRAELRAIYKPAIPVVSTLLRPVFYRMMKSDITKDIAGLKELCETGSVASRKAEAASTAA
ncbi:MAG: DUF2652 domain-containing protein [Chloroflexota bacterium]